MDVSPQSIIVEFAERGTRGKFYFSDGFTVRGYISALDLREGTLFRLRDDSAIYNLAQVVRIEIA